jgi:hypothetical protein
MNVEFLKDVALAVPQEQDLETVMKMIVKGIKEEAGLLWSACSFSHQGIFEERLICARSAQSKLVACTWLVVKETNNGSNYKSSREVARTRVNLRILMRVRYECRVPQKCRSCGCSRAAS